MVIPDCGFIYSIARENAKVVATKAIREKGYTVSYENGRVIAILKPVWAKKFEAAKLVLPPEILAAKTLASKYYDYITNTAVPALVLSTTGEETLTTMLSEISKIK